MVLLVVTLIIVLIVGSIIQLRRKNEDAEMRQVDRMGSALHSAMLDILSKPPTLIDGFGDSFDWVHTLLRERGYSTWNVGNEKAGVLVIRGRSTSDTGRDTYGIDLSITDPAARLEIDGENVLLTAFSSRYGGGGGEYGIFAARLSHEEIFSGTFAETLRTNIMTAMETVSSA